MDSVTQFALGACVGVAVLGRKIGPRRAALTGGVLGTVPDLDVFLASDNPIESFVEHRGWSHSLFVHAALTPVFGELVRLWSGLRTHRASAYLAVFLCLTTHALLDAMTVYGTRLFWPLSTDPVGVGSIFIIDPLYSLPLLVAMICAACLRTWTAPFQKVLSVCLVLSTAYLGWTLIAQHWMTQRAKTVLARAGVTAERMLVIPTPFNTLLWRAITLKDDQYVNLYVPVLSSSDSIPLYLYPRNTRLASCFGDGGPVAKVAHFSRGYYRLEMAGGKLLLGDIRMGLTPNYSFKFSIAALKDGKLRPTPPRRLARRGSTGNDMDWLLANITGDPVLRTAEAHAHVKQRLASTAMAPTLRAQC